MESRRKILFVINPASSGGKALIRWNRLFARIKDRLPDQTQVAFTKGIGDARRITSQAAADFELIVAGGGDGTVNEVMNGLLDGSAPENACCPMGVLPLGTGCDFARTLSAPHQIEFKLRNWLQNPARRIDVGRVNFTGFEGDREERCFGNVMSIGISSEVLRLVNGSNRHLGPKLTYLVNVVRALFSWDNVEVEISVDQDNFRTTTINTVICANGRYFGGGMLPAPQADFSDGQLDLVTIGDISRLQGVTNLPRLFRGTLGKHPLVDQKRFYRIQVRSELPLPVELDGELVGALPMDVTVIPRALRLVY